jgi:hypothetical protein
MKEDFAATRYDVTIESLLLQVSAKLQKAGCAKKIDAEEWLRKWLKTPNPAFDGACPRVFLTASEADPSRLMVE